MMIYGTPKFHLFKTSLYDYMITIGGLPAKGRLPFSSGISYINQPHGLMIQYYKNINLLMCIELTIE